MAGSAGSYRDETRAVALQSGLAAGTLGAGVLLAVTALQLPVICPLRILTGVPCPLCGMTTGTVDLLRGDIRGALSANPLSVLFVPGLVAFTVQKLRRLVLGSPAVVFPRAAIKAVLLLAVPIVVTVWMFELHRFGIL